MMVHKSMEEILTSFDFSKADVGKVKQGEVINRVVPSTNERELAAFFATTVDADMETIKEIFVTSSIKKETDPAIVQLGVINDPANPDFSSLKLNAASAKDYLSAKPGDSFNMTKSEYEKFKELGKKASTTLVEEVLRQILKQRFLDYHQRGLEGISPYQRSRETYEPGKELHLKTSKSLKVKEAFPAFHKYLLEYPNSKPSPEQGEIEEAYTWINFDLEGNNTVCLTHKLVCYMPDKAVVMFERHFYVGRSHNSTQLIGCGLKPEDETLVLTVSRTSTDQVTGFGGAAKRTIGANIMCGRLAENFQRRKAAAEKKQQQ